MYADEESDTESKATTSGRSVSIKTPLQTTPKPQPKTRTLQVVSNEAVEEQKSETSKKQQEISMPQTTGSSSQQTTQQQSSIPKTDPKPQPQVIKPTILTESHEKPKASQSTKPTVGTSGQQSVISPTQAISESKQAATNLHDLRQRPSTMQSSIRRPSRDQDHLSIACHLFPRLSETNLNFHDIYYGIDPKTQKIFLRKRMVNVSKMFSFHSLQSVKRPAQAISSDESTFKLHLFLVDLRPRAEQQIVSNVHALEIPIQQTRFGIFCQKSAAKSVLVRSNYKQPEVVLRAELFQSSNSLGFYDIPLLNDKQESRLPQRTQTLTIGDFKFCFDSSDPSPRIVGQTDCLPDILICFEEWIPMLATFRQLSAEVLANREKRQQTTWISDPIMATFPTVCESRQLVNMFLLVLSKKPRLSVTTFRRTYMQYIYPVVNTLQLDEKQLNEYRLRLEKNNENPVEFMSEERCTPLNVFQYNVHLSGYHAID